MNKVDGGLRVYYNKMPEYNKELRKYFLGPLGNIADNYYNFISEDFRWFLL